VQEQLLVTRVGRTSGDGAHAMSGFVGEGSCEGQLREKGTWLWMRRHV
jgi:hypothetical protein